MFHYLFVGRFEHAAGGIRFSPPHPKGFEVSKPVVTEPIGVKLAEKIAQLVPPDVSSRDLPRSCVLPNRDGFLVFDRSELSKSDIEYIRLLVSYTGCDVYDYSSGTIMRPEDLEVSCDSRRASYRGP